MTAAVADLAERVWQERERRNLKRDAMGLSRAIAVAVGHDVRDYPDYDPGRDFRVKWLMEIAENMRGMHGWKTPRASGDVEFALLMAMGKLERETCGKELAARSAE
jgi:hypothetical protein